MYSYTFESIQNLNNQNILQNGTFLWIIQAHRIPPHIGISSNGKYYSIKATGKDLAIDYKSLLKVINAKNKLVVLVELTDLNHDFDSLLYSKFHELQEINSEFVSCLSPINSLIFPNKNHKTVSDLLKSLKANGRIGAIYGLNLTEDFIGIPLYGEKDIQERIEKLKNAARSKSEITTS